MIDREKGSKTLSEVKPVKNISKNPQNYLEKSPVQNSSVVPNDTQKSDFHLPKNSLLLTSMKAL